MLNEKKDKREYSCLMLDCSDFKNTLETIQSNIKEDDIYDEPGHGLEDEPHITVLYGIHEQSPELVKDVMDLYPVEYTLEKLSLFENENYDVLKCSVESEGLRALNKQATDNLEYTSNFPDYKPHLTIAYLNPGCGKKYLKIKYPNMGEPRKSGKFVFSDKDSNKTYWNVEE